MAGAWTPPRSDGSGRDRDMARRALALAATAGWRLRDGALTRDGKPLSFEILVASRDQERLALIFPGSCAASAWRRGCARSMKCNISAAASVSTST